MDYSLIASIVVLLLSFLGLSWFAGSDAPFVTTKITDLTPLFKAAGLKKGKYFYELGSGDGRIVFAAAKLGAESHGVEQSWLRVWFSRIKAKQLGLKGCHFYHGNIFDRQYFPADVVFIFLLQNAVDKLEKKLPKELKKGSIIITQTFHFKNLKPFKKLDLSQKNKKVMLSKTGFAGDFWLYKIK